MLSRLIAGAFAAAFLLVGSAGAQQAPPPVEAYGRLPSVSNVAISPDGRHIIMRQADGEATAFRIINLETQQSVYAARIESPTTLRSVGWADNEHAVIYVSTTANTGAMGVYVRGNTRVEYWRAGVFSLRTNRLNYMLDDIPDAHLNTGLVSLRAPIEGDPGYGRMTAWEREGSAWRLVVYRVNLDGSGRSRVASRGDGSDADQYFLDVNGNIAARSDSDDQTNRWQVYSYASGSPRLVLEGTEETGSSPDIYGFTADGSLVVYAPDENNVWRMVTISSSGQVQELTPDFPENDCVVTDRWSKQVVGYCWEEEFDKFHYYQEDLAAVQRDIDGLFADGFGYIVSWSRDRSRYVIYGETARDGGAYYVYEPARDSILQVGLRYPELTNSNFGVRQSIRFPARDGTSVPAYMHLPSANTRNAPTVVLVHGGPHLVHDTFEFDWWSAFLVSRGYAVLQVNYRGSGGYGRAWETAGRGNWGDGVMQTDVLDGVDAMIRGGIADPRRICIMGASYGGYAALAGATLTPDKFACAVSVAGVSDLPMMLDENAGRRNSGSAEWWRLSIGDRRADRAHLQAVSPSYQAANVTAPILLMHGNEDTVVPIAQSRRMRDRLQAAGKNVRYVELAGDDHWLSSAATRTQMLREIESFLAQNLGPGAQ